MATRSRGALSARDRPRMRVPGQLRVARPTKTHSKPVHIILRRNESVIFVFPSHSGNGLPRTFGKQDIKKLYLRFEGKKKKKRKKREGNGRSFFL